MLSVHWSTVRLFLHVLAATVWVGGQLSACYLRAAERRGSASRLSAIRVAAPASS